MGKILVIDENDNDREKIVNTLLKIDNIIIYEASNCDQALDILMQNNISIIYMDTKLKGYEELEFAQCIRLISKCRFIFIIFISKNTEISKEAFQDVHCYNFYNKNYNEEKILKEIIMLLKNPKIYECEEVKAIENLEPINIESKNSIVQLKPNEILFIESQNRDVIVHTKTGSYNIYNMSIKKILELLPKEVFEQSHRSYIINCNNISTIKKYDRISWGACFNGYKLEALISDNYKDNVTKKIRERIRKRIKMKKITEKIKL